MTFPDTTTPLTQRRVTLYAQDDLMGCYVAIEASAYSVVVLPYAQFANAVHVRFVKRGGRRELGYVETSATTLVLDGWEHVAPDGLFPQSRPFEPGEQAIVVRARHSGCSAAWHTEFNAMIDAYMKSTCTQALADYRSHVVTEKTR